MQGVAPARAIVGGQRRARLHGIDHHPAVDELDPGDVCGLRKGRRNRIGIAVVIIKRNISGRFLMQQWRIGRCCRLRGCDRGQWIDVDLDGFGRVFCLQRRLGNDEGDRVADEADLVGGQDRANRGLPRRAVAIGPQFFAGDVARFEAGADGVLRRDSHPEQAHGTPPRGS